MDPVSYFLWLFSLEVSEDNKHNCLSNKRFLFPGKKIPTMKFRDWLATSSVLSMEVLVCITSASISCEFLCYNHLPYEYIFAIGRLHIFPRIEYHKPCI